MGLQFFKEHVKRLDAYKVTVKFAYFSEAIHTKMINSRQSAVTIQWKFKTPSLTNDSTRTLGLHHGLKMLVLIAAF